MGERVGTEKIREVFEDSLGTYAGCEGVLFICRRQIGAAEDMV